MPAFTTRVELHNATYSDYETLHAAMQRRGFSRRITSDSGTTYHLPTAEYDCSGNFTTQEVLNAAKAAASETKKRFSVLVTETVRRIWDGLEPVAQKSSVPTYR
jgi:hypothetical protein